MSLREKLSTTDVAEKRGNIQNELIQDYNKHGKYHVTRAEQRNIMLIGRTRTGKSTIKSLLVNPTVVPSDLTLKSDTRDPVFESFHINENNMVLNIIDTPGLFEHGNTEVDVRDNQVIMRTIEICANREITKFHAICFCVAITTGINKEDIASLKLLAQFLGDEISRNSCLIITRCESKNETQRNKMNAELMEDVYFKEIEHFFQLGVLFSGSLNPDDYEQANDSLYHQFITISDYRADMIKLFTGKIEPFLIRDSLISDVRHAQATLLTKDVELRNAQTRNEELERLIQEMRTAQENNQQQQMPALINRLENLNRREQTRHGFRLADRCVIS